MIALKALTIEELKSKLQSYVNPAKSGSTTWTATFDNLLGLTDKIGKTITISQNYIDKLGFMSGEDLREGKTVEEYHYDLIMPEDFDRDAEPALALANYKIHARKPSWSYTIGRKKLKVTRPYDDLERAALNASDAVEMVSGITKSLSDSETLYRYGLKKQLLGNFVKKVLEMRTSAVAWANATARAVDVCVKSGDRYGIVFNAYPANGATSFDDAIKKGYVVETTDMVIEVAKPTDTASGEAFLKKVQEAVEVASDNSMGNSLSGCALGAQSGLKLIMLQGVKPSLKVDTYAGAFNKGDLATGVEDVVVPNFGDADASVYAVLLDPRGIKLHNNYRAMRTDANGDTDIVTFTKHDGETPFISRNTFVRIFKVA